MGVHTMGGNETEIFFIIAILVISWRMKRHIFWEKSYGKVSLAKFFLTVYKIFLNNGGNASLSQRGWTPLQPLKKRFEKRYYEDVIDARPIGDRQSSDSGGSSHLDRLCAVRALTFSIVAYRPRHQSGGLL